MAIWLKEGKSESEIIEADEKVKRTVESILNDVSKRGDDAVRELSLKFDNYSPENFILTKNEIENIIDKVNKKDLEDKNIWSNFDNTCLNAKVISTVFKDKKSFICSKPLSVNLIGEREWVSLYDFIVLLILKFLIVLY